MMNDIEKALEALEEYGERGLSKETIGVIYAALEAQQADRWIPLNIGDLPLEYTDVFATLDNGSVYHLFYAKEKFRFGGYGGEPISGNVIAWMPFFTPEPYKEQQ